VTLAVRCGACATVVDADDAPLLCPSCKAIIPPHPHASPFARLGLAAPRFVLDERALEAAWLQRSRVVHPDKAARKPDAERRSAVEQTAALNDAWRLLRVPFDRAVWLVQQAGIAEPRLSQAALVAFMEAREEAEESALGRATVVARSRERFAHLQGQLRAELAVVDEVKDGYAAGSVETPRLSRVSLLLAEAKTLARLVDDLGGGALIPSLSGR